MNTIWIVLPILTLLIFANEEMAIPAILYSLMMNIVLLIYVAIVRKRYGGVRRKRVK